jgi:hypothetical protein
MIQMVPASVMNPIVKPWPFRGWGMDMIGKINPQSSKGHQFILAITDYFTKSVEAICHTRFIKNINRAIIYALGSSHAYIQQNHQDITTHIMNNININRK